MNACVRMTRWYIAFFIYFSGYSCHVILTPDKSYFFYSGYLLLDCSWSYNIPLLICHGESDLLYFQPHYLHIFSYSVWLAIGAIPATCSSVSSPCHISCKSSFSWTAGCSNPLWHSSQEHIVSAVFDQWSFTNQLLRVQSLSCCAIPLWITMCTWLVMHNYIPHHVWLAKGICKYLFLNHYLSSKKFHHWMPFGNNLDKFHVHWFIFSTTLSLSTVCK